MKGVSLRQNQIIHLLEARTMTNVREVNPVVKKSAVRRVEGSGSPAGEVAKVAAGAIEIARELEKVKAENAELGKKVAELEEKLAASETGCDILRATLAKHNITVEEGIRHKKK